MLEHPALPPVSRSYSEVWGRYVTHYSPVRHSHHPSKLGWIPFDLHVLSTPPAFVLSQNQTLHKKNCRDPINQTLKIIKLTRPRSKRPWHRTKTNQTRVKDPAGHWHQINFHKVAQTTLLSSQTTTPHTTRPAPKPAPTRCVGSKRRQYAKHQHNANNNPPGRVENYPLTGVRR
jgi:hypothetical protein